MSLLPTPKQAKVLSFIQAFMDEKGFAPSLEEIAAGIGVKAKSNIHYTLARLAERGFIRMPKGQSRAIQIVKPSEIMAFFETLPSGTQHIIRSIAMRQRTTNEAVMREWLNERADQFRSPCSQRVRP